MFRQIGKPASALLETSGCFPLSHCWTIRWWSIAWEEQGQGFRLGAVDSRSWMYLEKRVWHYLKVWSRKPANWEMLSLLANSLFAEAFKNWRCPLQDSQIFSCAHLGWWSKSHAGCPHLWNSPHTFTLFMYSRHASGPVTCAHCFFQKSWTETAQSALKPTEAVSPLGVQVPALFSPIAWAQR